MNVSLRHALLGMLADHPGSGYDLLKRFELSLNFVWQAKQSQLYGELGKMAEAGLIEVTGTGARNRKEYAITDAGRAELRRWLIGEAPDRTIRNEMLLRVFFLWTLEREEAVAYLEAVEGWAALRVDALEQLRERIKGFESRPGDLYSMAALEYGIRLSRTTKDWAESTKELAAGS
jgi:PadR family transcriptional regulator, regulatory protein AphA